MRCLGKFARFSGEDWVLRTAAAGHPALVPRRPRRRQRGRAPGALGTSTQVSGLGFRV